ncbi:MAG: hypothetical protein HZB35_00510 [Nitrospirae bacterium]|nr:hypothetical protein [Nitrospirota bacterium]
MAMLVGACAGAPPVVDHPNQRALEGKTRDQVFTCAGAPERERSHEDLTLLRYYREAPMLQESVVGSKGSKAGIHHGCWATVVLKDGKVLEVRYRSVPAGVDATDHCEEIFDSCVQSLPAP